MTNLPYHLTPRPADASAADIDRATQSFRNWVVHHAENCDICSWRYNRSPHLVQCNTAQLEGEKFRELQVISFRPRMVAP